MQKIKNTKDNLEGKKDGECSLTRYQELLRQSGISSKRIT